MMNPLNNSQIDDAILSSPEYSWRKVARVIVMTDKIFGDDARAYPISGLTVSRLSFKMGVCWYKVT